MRDSCIFYRSFYEAINELPLDEQGRIYNAVFTYALNFEQVELSGISKTVFTLIKPQLDANIKRYNNGNEPKNKQNRSKTEAKQKQNRSKTEANENVNDNVNVNKNGNENKNVNENKKEVTADFVKSDNLFGLIKNHFLSFYLQKAKTEYYFSAKDGIKIKSIIKKLEFKIKEKNIAQKKESKIEEKEIFEAFKFLLENIKDQWILENLSTLISG